MLGERSASEKLLREKTASNFKGRGQDIDDQIKRTKAREFLRVEYKVKNFIETTLGIEIKGDVSEAARNGIAVEFLNALAPPAVKYNKNPKNNFHFIENVSFFNQICLDQSKFKNLFTMVDVVDTANVTKSTSMVQVLNNLYRIIKYCQAQNSSDVKDFVHDEDIPEEAFEKSQIERAVEIIKEVEIEQKTNTHAPSLLADLEENELKRKEQEAEDADAQKRMADEAEAQKKQEEDEAEAKRKQDEDAEAKRKQEEEEEEARKQKERDLKATDDNKPKENDDKEKEKEKPDNIQCYKYNVGGKNT